MAEADKSLGPATGDVGVAEVSDLLKVLVTGGTGAALLRPCLSASFTTGGSSSASFGSVAAFGPLGSTCGTGLTDDIPIVFGVPLFGKLLPSAEGGGIDGSGTAAFQGFVVLDGNGDPISATITTTVLTPEPSALIFCLLGLAASMMKRERQQPQG
jgi:hypothetical protein